MSPYLVLVILLLALLAAGEVAPAAAQTLPPCPTRSATPASDPRLTQDCNTLLELKDQLDPGDRLNWDSAVSISTWIGVIADTTLGVTELVHVGTDGAFPLNGTIPSALGNLPALQALELTSSGLTGGIPAALGNLTNLQYLWLYNNQLTGGIPAALGNLTNLMQLSLHSNQLSGRIPTVLGTLTNLQYLWLYNNQLTGTIPNLSALTSLEGLGLHNNRLTGEIPAVLGNLTNLQELLLGNNRLSGTIPTALGTLTNLQFLWLYSNRLTGEIPAVLGNLTDLQALSLHSNRLSGTIPTELSNLTNLRWLWLYNNQLTGTIPDLSALTSLEFVGLYDNELSGAVPSTLGSLTSLRELWLSNNELTGTIPNLSALTSLEYLDLWNNQLSGTIPSALGSLTSLQGLYLACNQLEGSIPTALGTITALEEVYLHGNRLDLANVPANLQATGRTVILTRLCRPTGITVTPGARTLTVAWAPPSNAAAIPVTAYDVRHRRAGATDWITVAGSGATARAHTLTGLNNGTAYEVRVRARAADGTVDEPAGDWSATRTGTPSGPPPPPPPPKSSNGSTGSGGGSRVPSPPPVPTRSPIIGSTPAATAKEVAGDLLVLQRHDQPGVEVEVGVGWISRDGQRIIVIGFVRDGDLGQTYAVVRREGDGQVVRRWIAPDSPLVYAVPWAVVNTQYTFPVGVVLAIPLDEQYPPPHMLMRRFDGGDDRILAYDAALGQWRHVPDPATFQALGFYWCNVTAADAAFFARITLGPPHPASDAPARADYPVCPP